MATKYRKTSDPIRPWRPRDHTRFESVIKMLKQESYPNGNWGWEDHAAPKFEAVGFRVKFVNHGDPHNVTIITLDIRS